LTQIYQFFVEDPRPNSQYSNSRADQLQAVGFRGGNIESTVQNQGVKPSQSRGNTMQHSTSQGGLDKNATQVTVLGDSPTDYVAAGTRNGDFMGVPKTKSSVQGKTNQKNYKEKREY
jgi:hypothetical protein